MNLLLDEIREITKNPTLASVYAKQNCKQCHGKGWIIRSFPVDGTSAEFDEVCKCVKKGLQKQFGNAGLRDG